MDRVIFGLPSANDQTIAYTLFTGGDMCEPRDPPAVGDRIALSLISQGGAWTAADAMDEQIADEMAAEMRLSDQD
ncbi:hypothetical protein [Brevundimonas sp. LjRoot202]|uniref:hypothetical protein n=1 Tax=Brevundimonas sp. LjRoot202 TaxID=3342281 RepID=UPI003ECEC2AA